MYKCFHRICKFTQMSVFLMFFTSSCVERCEELRKTRFLFRKVCHSIERSTSTQKQLRKVKTTIRRVTIHFRRVRLNFERSKGVRRVNPFFFLERSPLSVNLERSCRTSKGQLNVHEGSFHFLMISFVRST
ncbi:hypothetical protein HanRHA438_Chr04g0163931 [Helianthus annuus]|nr:hypothetical protein HanRHA438_Chr04g0163931 [Helianthus annuus]